MQYELVNLEEKTIVGVSAVTGNDEPDMSAVIGGLWQKLYQGGVYAQIQNKCNDHAVGLYSDYTEQQYTVTVGAEVSLPQNQELTVKTIPAGNYAKFLVHGDVKDAVAASWQEIWNTPLDRSFTGDFEEYFNGDGKTADIAIYIALK